MMERYILQNVKYSLQIVKQNFPALNRILPEKQEGQDQNKMENHMRLTNKTIAGITFLLLLAVLCAMPVLAATSTTVTSVTAATTPSSLTSTTNSQDAASLVYVSSIDYDPKVWYPYETGTITVYLTNTGTTSVGLTHPDLLGSNVHLLNTDLYDVLTYIGPGATISYTFNIEVDPPEGYSYPLFTVGTKDAQSIHFPIQIQIDSTPVRASISQKPDDFAIERTDMVNVSITNPRDGDINDVLIVPEGTGVDFSPSEAFQPLVSAGSSFEVPFSVTPHQAGNVTFHVTYRNGENQHTADVVLPLNIAEDKTASVPVINNIALTTTGGAYQIAGDVTNAGITDAAGMIVTVLPPAKPVEPYTNYAVGTLASDDFSSFQVTFTATDLSAIPVQVQWKDATGNTFTNTTTLDLRSLASGVSGTTRTGSTGSFTGNGGAAAGAARGGGGGAFGIFGGSSRGGGLSAFYLPIGLAILVIIAVILWMKRKWILSKLKKQ